MAQLWLHLNFFDIAAGLCILTLVLFVSRRMRSQQFHLRFPPGPKRLPLVGNLFDLPQSHEWRTYRKWAQDYGWDVLHCDVFGSHLLVVNSAAAAEDLFDKRASLYSDRPQMRALNEILGFDWELAFMRFGDGWRRLRAQFHTHFQPAAAVRYRVTEARAVHDLLRRLHDSPDEFMQHLKHMSGEIFMSIGYGIQVESHNDPFVNTADKALQALAVAGSPRGLILDLLPFLNYMPAWFPGAGFKAERKNWHNHIAEMANAPFERVREAVANGNGEVNIAATILQQGRQQDSAVAERLARQLPASMYLAGMDTIVSSLASFLVAMVLHPEAQRKAQQELDVVLLGKRLPTFDDQAELPYVSAVAKEILRWRPAVPMGLPHSVVADDTYKGHYIPAGTTILGNVWAILHDEDVYTNPDVFMPERFLDPSTPDPEAAFGFGKRKCPGRFMATDTLFIAIASILATFDITPSGGDPEFLDRYTSGIISYPLPFKCSLHPRSKV
ncbi:cytochrome P450 [Auriscalpium vulgare]|uniref:Cytochrome P450 n=1 Tax=Auriscalpium vulgare TaxID=40419 RepID=A0ACB8RCZ9_9AGAM|nr:cytochrome P450 [Auriscalpium vulgare]